MPDSRLAEGFLETSKLLISEAKKPSQASLRRSVSSAYYAAFHCLAKVCADCLIGSTKSKRPNKAWVEVYRGLNHSTCLEACRKAQSIAFPETIHNFADTFVQLQRARHDADYDPLARFDKRKANLYIALASKSIEQIRSCSITDRRAFAAWVLITSKGATAARQKAKEERDGRR